MRNPPACRALKCIEQKTFVQWTKQRISTGFHVFARCANGCHVMTHTGGIWAPKMWFTREEIEAMPFAESWPLETCPVCGTSARLETHHLAPKEMFGEESARWPTVDVCRACHEHWHARMGRVIGRREAAE